MIVIGLSGRMGAGKGTVAQYLKEKHQAEQFVYSNILADILKRLDLPVERENLQKLGSGLRDSLGSEVLVNAMRSDVGKSASEIRLIDGLRYINEVEMLRSFENNLLVFVDAPTKIRFKRIKARAEKGEEKLTLDQFKEREKAPTELGLEKIKKQADFIIDNSGTLEDLYHRVDKILNGK